MDGRAARSSFIRYAIQDTLHSSTGIPAMTLDRRALLLSVLASNAALPLSGATFGKNAIARQ